jgi:hypothetical protein
MHTPWYAGLAFAVLTYVKMRYPEYSAAVDSFLVGLAASWGVHLTQTVKNGNGNGNGKSH